MVGSVICNRVKSYRLRALCFHFKGSLRGFWTCFFNLITIYSLQALLKFPSYSYATYFCIKSTIICMLQLGGAYYRALCDADRCPLSRFGDKGHLSANREPWSQATNENYPTRSSRGRSWLAIGWRVHFVIIPLNLLLLYTGCIDVLSHFYKEIGRTWQ